MGVRQVQGIQAAELSDGAAFHRDVVQHCEPVILRGLCGDWPAVVAGRQEWAALARYLTEKDSGRTGRAFIGHATIRGRYDYGGQADGFNFSSEMLSVTQVIERMTGQAGDPDAPSIYLGSLPMSECLPAFAAENAARLLDSSVEPRLWIGTASDIACHYDTFDNLACVVAGRRRFTLYPPDSIGGLYVGPIDHTMAGAPVALAAGSAKGDERYPRFEAVRDRAMVAELEPGDALFLPKLWWHRVEATEPANVLVNYWWDAFSAGPDAPMTAMMLAMIAIAERPLAERHAWAAWFDHYVFRERGHPLAHLPEAQHGILGALKSGNYGRIRAFVMQKLRGM
ncbi:MAG: cupin-like domain-containing protein [Sphingobium sp.]|nr:cupin-like domain-containing protein [Sphingobium sp.]